jgi:beta-mannosidase
MYSVLLEHKLIEDPFYGINEEKATTLSDLDCIFETEFTLDEETLDREYIELRFLGIDTICDIIVNGNTIASVKNMHREYIYDVKNFVVKKMYLIQKYYVKQRENIVNLFLELERMWSK